MLTKKLNITKGEWFPVQYGEFINIQDNPRYGESNLLDTKQCKEAFRNAELMAASPKLLETCANLQKRLEQLILMTPSGNRRNELTEENMQVSHFLNQFNALKEFEL